MDLFRQDMILLRKNLKDNFLVAVLHDAIQMLMDVITAFRKTEAHIRVKDAIYYQVGILSVMRSTCILHIPSNL